tara:strand:- start:4107 stop:4949 length:843 start_codon:yes stop_codon:yes gene_type:complete
MFSKGLKHMFLAGLFFSFMNLGVKLLGHIPVLEIVFIRALIMIIITLSLLKRYKINPLGNNKKILFLRGFFGVIALSLYFYSIQNMPFASAVTIMQLSPIFTTLVAIVILKEKIKPIQLLFFLLSFIGVVFIKGFDTNISFKLLLIALSGSFLSALAYNMIRKLKDTDHPLVVVFYFPFVALPITGVLTAFNFVMPKSYDWLILLMIGLSTQFAQINMTKALQMEKIAKVSIVRYLTIIYAIVYSYLFFNEEYNYYAFFGMGLVVLGIVLNLVYTVKKKV